MHWQKTEWWRWWCLLNLCKANNNQHPSLNTFSYLLTDSSFMQSCLYNKHLNRKMLDIRSIYKLKKTIHSNALISHWQEVTPRHKNTSADFWNSQVSVIYLHQLLLCTHWLSFDNDEIGNNGWCFWISDPASDHPSYGHQGQSFLFSSLLTASSVMISNFDEQPKF